MCGVNSGGSCAGGSGGVTSSAAVKSGPRAQHRRGGQKRFVHDRSVPTREDDLDIGQQAKTVLDGIPRLRGSTNLHQRRDLAPFLRPVAQRKRALIEDAQGLQQPYGGLAMAQPGA